MIPTTMVDVLGWRARTQSHQIAFTFLGNEESIEEEITYGQLDERARSIAGWLQTQLADGERALLVYPPGLEYIAAFFGCLYAGVVAVPAYPPRNNRSLPRLQAIVADCKPKLLLTNGRLLSTIQEQCSRSSDLASIPLLATDELPHSDAASWKEPKLCSDQLAFLQYTSGSTAMPKGAMVSHGNLIHNQQTIKTAFAHTEQSTFVGWLPLYHDMGLIGNVLQPLYIGVRCFLMSPLAFCTVRFVG
jgi:acyl-CoA synthetase (AMP-forming)/AMP-acid ligase II